MNNFKSPNPKANLMKLSDFTKTIAFNFFLVKMPMSYVIAFLLMLLNTNIIAQQTTILDSVNFYGSLRAHFAVFNQTAEVQNNASRIGFYLQRGVWNGFTADANLELGVNLLKNNNSFNPDAATASDAAGFLVQNEAAVSTRLGYIGLHKDKLGSLLIGKQWSTYYDVSKFTDAFNVFGGSASGTYNTNSDGGGEGTGRSENAITYRNRWKDFSFGAQAQFPSNDFNFGGSVLYDLPKGFTIGAAYNYYEVPDNVKNVIINERNTANSFVVAAKFQSKKTYAAICYDFNQSESQYPEQFTAIGFSASGIEAYMSHYLTNELLVYGGINYLTPQGTPDSLSENFKILYFPVGVAYYFVPDFYCYTEARIDLGTTSTGENATSVFTIGVRYDFLFGHGKIRTR